MRIIFFSTIKFAAMVLNLHVICLILHFTTSTVIAAEDARQAVVEDGGEDECEPEGEEEEEGEEEDMPVVAKKHKLTTKLSTCTRIPNNAIYNVEKERLVVAKEQLGVSKQIAEALANISQTLSVLLNVKLQENGMTLVNEG